MSVTWTAGADFDGTGSPSSDFIANPITVPPGMVSGNAAMLVIAAAGVVSPGTGFSGGIGIFASFVDVASNVIPINNGLGLNTITFGESSSPSPWGGGGFSISDATIVAVGGHSLSEGGTIRLALAARFFPLVPGTQTFSGILVAALSDGSGGHPQALDRLRSSVNTTQVQASAFLVFPAGKQLLERFIVLGGGLTVPASPADFTPDLTWENTVVRSRGVSYAGIGRRKTPLPSPGATFESISWSYTPFNSGAPFNQDGAIEAQVIDVVRGGGKVMIIR